MTREQAIAAARKKLEPVGVFVEADARVIELDDPDATGVAVEVWVYLMERDA